MYLYFHDLLKQLRGGFSNVSVLINLFDFYIETMSERCGYCFGPVVSGKIKSDLIMTAIRVYSDDDLRTLVLFLSDSVSSGALLSYEEASSMLEVVAICRHRFDFKKNFTLYRYLFFFELHCNATFLSYAAGC